MTIPTIFKKTVQINAPASIVWDTLTKPALMKKWMSETEIEIITNWKIDSTIVIRGNMNGKYFENAGTVLQYATEQVIEYTHLSSVSRLPDKPENHVHLTFRLTPNDAQTTLTFTAYQFPTEIIYKHLAFYWNVTLEILKKSLESQETTSL